MWKRKQNRLQRTSKRGSKNLGKSAGTGRRVQERKNELSRTSSTLYPDFAFQTIEGFGGAMTESSAYLLSRMDEETQNQALQDIFGPDGLHARFVRVPIDSCDYSLEEYQAVADPVADRIWQPSRSTATANMSFRC